MLEGTELPPGYAPASEDDNGSKIKSSGGRKTCGSRFFFQYCYIGWQAGKHASRRLHK